MVVAVVKTVNWSIMTIAEVLEILIETNIREAHFVYAREIVRMYHGENAVIQAESRYKKVASGKSPENIETVTLPNKGIDIIDLLRKVSFAASNGDARRLILGGGIKINGETISDNLLVISNQSEIVLSKGKNKFVKVFFK